MDGSAGGENSFELGIVGSEKKTAASRGSSRVTSGGHIISKRKAASGEESFSTLLPITPLPTQHGVNNFLDSKRGCCRLATYQYSCLETYFLVDNDAYQDEEDSIKTVDTTKLYRFITALRTVTRSKNKQELDDHVMSEVRRCIVGTQTRRAADGVSESKHFVYEWSLALIAGQDSLGPFGVCREVFAFAWGISVDHIKRVSSSFKSSEFGYAKSSTVKSFTDESRYFEQFSFDDVEAIMRENVTLRQGNKDSDGGNELFTLGSFEIDSELVRAAMTPMSESDRFCINWLNEYSLQFGDAAPNDKEHSLNQGSIQNQYTEHYLPAATKQLKAMNCFLCTSSSLSGQSRSEATEYYSGLRHDENDSDLEADVMQLGAADEFDEKASRLRLGGPVTYARFCELWRVVFPDLVNRPYRSLHGKCKWCGNIDVGKKQCTDEMTMKHYTYAHLLHRTTFMKERWGYYSRRSQVVTPANLAFPTILSIIIDLEDSSKTGLPYLAKEATFNNKLDHHLTGAKIHGDHVHFFPTMNTVGKSASLTCFCILRTIEMFHEKHKRFPETIYIQIDGGSENANETVLALCELLVIKRICKVLHLTRLPPGHTHDDIDAIFGVIWRWFHRSKVYLTIKDFQDGVQNAFKITSLSIKFEDLVYIVPDYEQWLSRCIDARLQGLFKEEKAMLCHKFIAVTPSIYFPLGVKWTYRAFWSDWVIDFIQKPPHKCISPIGQHTGIEPVMLLSVWHPTKDYDPNRPVEGIYCLRDLPDQVDRLPPASLKEECIVNMRKTLTEIRSSPAFQLEGRNAAAKDWWEAWFTAAIPPSLNATEYEAHLIAHGIQQPLRQPLGAFLYNRSWLASAADGANWIQSRGFLEEDGVPQWIAELGFKGLNISGHADIGMPVAISGNSVMTEFNPNPVNPRIFTVSGLELEQLTDQWTTVLGEQSRFYGEVPRNIMKETLLYSVNQRKVSFEKDAELAPTSATKPGLVARMRRFDLEFYLFMHRSLAKAESIFINSYLSLNRDAWERGPGQVFRGASPIWSQLQVSKDTLLRLVPGPGQGPMVTADFVFMMKLFEARDQLLKSRGARMTPAVTYRPSVFKVLNTWAVSDAIINFDAEWHRAYFLIPYITGHVLLVLQADSKTYQLVTTVANVGAQRYSKTMAANMFKSQNRTLIEDGWKEGPIGPLNSLLFLIDSINVMELKHSGVFFIYCIYFLLLDVPVYFDAKVPKLRENLAYYCIKGNLPF